MKVEPRLKINYKLSFSIVPEEENVVLQVSSKGDTDNTPLRREITIRVNQIQETVTVVPSD